MLRVLPPTNQTCLATIQVVAGWEKKLLRKAESSILFATKPLYVARFTGKANVFCSE